jgi:hypothetical protein
MISRLSNAAYDCLQISVALILIIGLFITMGYAINYKNKHPEFYTIKLNFNNSIVEYKHVRYYGASSDQLWFYDKDDHRITFSGSWILEREITPEKE